MSANSWSMDAVMLGESPAMRALRRQVDLAAAAGLPVLVHGETGSGKELVALELHRRSGRAGPFVPVNACAPAETMFEAAMFGHERGAFTGALGARKGFFAEAHLGTLFLDEICSLSLDAQAKLLRAIDTKRFRPVGGRTDIESDFRLVSATNRALLEEVDCGRFRADLFYRVHGLEIEVPPLRARREDIVPLLRHFMTLADPDGAAPRTLCDDALRFLMHHSWPGNVRELRHVAWRASVRAAGEAQLRLEHLSTAGDGLRSARGTSHFPRTGSCDTRATELLALLDRHGWDTAAVAGELGVSRKTVYARMQRARVSPRGRS